VTPAVPVDAGAIPGSSPRITISDAALDYQLRAAAISPDGAAIHLVSASYPRGRPSGAEPPVWTVVDAAGKVVSQDDPLSKLPPETVSTVRKGLTPPRRWRLRLTARRISYCRRPPANFACCGCAARPTHLPSAPWTSALAARLSTGC
jgi:hypothetical protein